MLVDDSVFCKEYSGGIDAGEKLIISYDKIGDFPFIEICRSYAEQDSAGIGNDTVTRFSLVTGEINTIEILFLRCN